MTSFWNMIIHVQDQNFKFFFSNFRISTPLCRHYKLINSVWVTSSGVSAPLEWNKWWFSNFGFRKILANIWIKKCHRIFMNFSKFRIKCQNRGFQDIQIDEFNSIVNSSVWQIWRFSAGHFSPVRVIRTIASQTKDDSSSRLNPGILMKFRYSFIAKKSVRPYDKNANFAKKHNFVNFIKFLKIFLTKNLT